MADLEDEQMPGAGVNIPEAVALAAPDLLSLTAALPDGAGQEPVPHASPSQEAAIDQRLAQLSALADGAAQESAPKAIPSGGQSRKPDVRFSQDVDCLEAMMQRMSPGAPNPEMQQMEALLERIPDIQHPERLRNRAEESTPQDPPPALLQSRPFAITLLGEPATPFSSKQPATIVEGETAPVFYSLPFQHQAPATRSNAIPAVVPSTQPLTTGALVRMRLLGDLHLEGRQIPRGDPPPAAPAAFARAPPHRDQLRAGRAAAAGGITGSL